MAMYYRLTPIDFQVGRWRGVDEWIDGVEYDMVETKSKFKIRRGKGKQRGGKQGRQDDLR